MERALTALGNEDPESARRAMARAVDLDQLGIYTEVQRSVELAAADLDSGNPVAAEHWDAIEGSLGPGPLAAKVQELR